MVAAFDQALSVAPARSELRRVRLNELGNGLEPSWDRRPQRRRPLRSLAVLEITAVDVNSYLLREGASLARAEGLADRITFREDNAQALSLPDNSVDVSLSFTVMEEVNADRMLHEMVRVTKPGGRVGVVVRAADMEFWTNLALRPDLLAKIKSAPSAGAADLGCADASLYQRFRAAGLHDLKMGPQLATHQPADGVEFQRNFSARILQGLAGAEAEECRALLARAIGDGTFVWADPYHSAVGTRD
jgi:SAM-dependent methyltransferase